MSLSLPLPSSPPLSMATRRPSHELTLCFQKPFVWFGSRTDSIMSEGQEVKKARVASCFSLHEMARMVAGKEKKKKKRNIQIRGNHSASKHRLIFLWKHAFSQNIDIHTGYALHNKCPHSAGKK